MDILLFIVLFTCRFVIMAGTVVHIKSLKNFTAFLSAITLHLSDFRTSKIKDDVYF